MPSVADIIDKLQGIDVDAVTEAIFNDHKEDLVNLNIENLDKGLNVDNEIVGTYSNLTEEIARISNPALPKIAGQPYNFVWTGDLISNIFVSLRENTITTDSTGSGTGDKLRFVQENKILGISKDKENYVNKEIFEPEYQKRIAEKLK